MRTAPCTGQSRWASLSTLVHRPLKSTPPGSALLMVGPRVIIIMWKALLRYPSGRYVAFTEGESTRLGEGMYQEPETGLYRAG